MATRKTARVPSISDTPNASVRAKLIAFAHMYRGGDDSVRGNGKACYRVLHPKASSATAESKTSAYLNHPIVKEILDQHTRDVCEQADITQEMIFNELRKLAFFDVRKLFHDDGSPKSIGELDDETAGAIIGLDAVNIGNSEAGIGQVLKYKLADKKGALELFGKHLKLWTDKVEASVAGGKSLDDLLKQARDESE